MKGKHFALIIASTFYLVTGMGQQLCDNSFNPVLSDPLYEKGKGPKVYIDQAHHNFHTKDGRYCGFSKILEADGYQVLPFSEGIKAKSLRGVDILVISNSQNVKNKFNPKGETQADRLRGWRNPIYPSFAESEEENLVRWVEKGGALLLIADHHPFPGAVSRLALNFGIEFSNGYALINFERGGNVNGNITFNPADNEDGPGLNSKHPIFKGLNGKSHSVDKVVGFTGSSFIEVDHEIAEITPLLRVPPNTSNLETEISWEFAGIEPQPAAGWLQGAAINYGKGRVIVLGEAAMLTAQTARRGGETFHIGVSAPQAEDNQQFVRNLIYWLDGKL